MPAEPHTEPHTASLRSAHGRWDTGRQRQALGAPGVAPRPGEAAWGWGAAAVREHGVHWGPDALLGQFPAGQCTVRLKRVGSVTDTGEAA